MYGNTGCTIQFGVMWTSYVTSTTASVADWTVYSGKRHRIAIERRAWLEMLANAKLHTLVDESSACILDVPQLCPRIERRRRNTRRRRGLWILPVDGSRRYGGKTAEVRRATPDQK